MNNNNNINESGFSSKDVKNPNKGPDFWKYLNIVLIALLLFIGVQRFVGPVIGTGTNKLSKIGLEYYTETYGAQLGTEGVESVVQNFGCHKEIHIFKDGVLVMRLSYFNGKVYEL